MTDEQTSWAIQRSLDRQEAEFTRGPTPEEEYAMEHLIDCPGCEIPPATKESLERYVYQRINPGSFIRAVLENDFMEAIGRADPANTVYLKQIAQHVYSCLPSPCHGSNHAVRSWLGKTNEW